jgi:hypothetical protein
MLKGALVTEAWEEIKWTSAELGRYMKTPPKLRLKVPFICTLSSVH